MFQAPSPAPGVRSMEQLSLCPQVWMNWPRKDTKVSPAVVAAMPGGLGAHKLIRTWTRRRRIPCQVESGGGEQEALCSSWPDSPWAEPAPFQTQGQALLLAIPFTSQPRVPLAFPSQDHLCGYHHKPLPQPSQDHGDEHGFLWCQPCWERAADGHPLPRPNQPQGLQGSAGMEGQTEEQGGERRGKS